MIAKADTHLPCGGPLRSVSLSDISFSSKKGNFYACCSGPRMSLVTHFFHKHDSSMTSSNPEYSLCVEYSCERYLCQGQQPGKAQMENTGSRIARDCGQSTYGFAKTLANSRGMEFYCTLEGKALWYTPLKILMWALRCDWLDFLMLLATGNVIGDWY